MKNILNVVKKTFAILLLTVLLLSLSGCQKLTGIEDLAYVLAIGIDSVEGSNNIELTLQFATAGSSNSSGSSMQSTKINISSVKCPTIDSGISLLNSHISKKINLTHCKVIVISENVAKQGLEDHLDTLINNTELTNDSEIIISKCTAKEFIEGVNPVFEGLLSVYYKSTLRSNEYVAYATDMNLSTFYCLLKDTYYHPYANLGNIESTQNNTSSPEESVNGNFTAGNYKFSDDNPIQIVGLAAFKHDKLVGEFTGLDTLCFLILNNEFEQSNISIPSPLDESEYLDLSVTSNKKTKCKVDINNNIPTVHIDVYLTGFGQSMDEHTSYGDEYSIQKIHDASESYIKNHIESFLYKTSKDYGTDICGFGRFAVKHYLTMEEWRDANWLENYKNCEFDVNVHFNIKAGNVISET